MEGGKEGKSKGGKEKRAAGAKEGRKEIRKNGKGEEGRKNGAGIGAGRRWETTKTLQIRKSVA